MSWHRIISSPSSSCVFVCAHGHDFIIFYRMLLLLLVLLLLVLVLLVLVLMLMLLVLLMRMLLRSQRVPTSNPC